MLAALVAVISSAPGLAQQVVGTSPDNSGASWFIKVSPYFWASNISGARTLGLPIDPNKPGEYELLVNKDALHPDFAMKLKAGRGKIGVAADLYSASVANDTTIHLAGADSINFRGRFDFTWRQMAFNLRYRIGPDLAPYVEMYVGIRSIRWTQDLETTEGAPLGSWDEHWIDPTIGGVTSIGLGAGFTAHAHFDFAGFGLGSELSWAVSGGVDFHVAGPLSLSALYHYQQISYDNGKSGPQKFEFRDGVAQGWLLGATVAFPGAAK